MTGGEIELIFFVTRVFGGASAEAKPEGSIRSFDEPPLPLVPRRRGPHSCDSHFSRWLDFDFGMKPDVERVENLHRTFKSDAEILVPFIT